MNDAPVQDQQSPQQQNTSGMFQPSLQIPPKSEDQHVMWTPSSSKEIEHGSDTQPEIGLSHASVEVELPKEVKNAGVSIKSTTIELPPNLTALGIQTVPAQKQTPHSTGGPKLPLTDDQIAAGLKQDFFSSWRWFSEWCTRKLKQAHLTVRSVHGKFLRVKT